jgi:hypothetical protein
MKSSWLVFILLVSACGSDDEASVDAGPPDARPTPDAPPVDPADASLMPDSLAQTGLYSDFANETLAPGVVEYTVNYGLWADGAEKRRFVFLPDGATINTIDMDFWSLPVGTKLWKEFSTGGVRTETRLIWKQGPTDEEWYAMSFAWTADQSQAYAAALGVEDALGTQHDIPSASACNTCHQRQPGYALGFSALQLDHDQGEINLASLAADGKLSNPPSRTDPPLFPLPGDDVERAAFGYLHGNCGTCHNEHSDVFRDRTSIIWHLDTDALATSDVTSIVRTTVGVPPLIFIGGQYTAVIEPGNPGASAALFRMTQRDPLKDSNVPMPPVGTEQPMPPVGTEQPDTLGGIAAVSTWIESLGP